MLSGEKVYLEAIEEKELETLRKWRNLPEYRKFFREYKEIDSITQKMWYDNIVLKDPATIMFSIKSKKNGELLGCCGLCYISWIHRYADLSLYIGMKEVYIDEAGYAEDSCNVLFKYAFNELGLNKIWTEIYEFDSLKNNLYRKIGFHQDGRLRQQYFYDGKWWDSYILSLLANEYRNTGSNSNE